MMVSHEQIKEVLRNWKLENEALTDVVYDPTGNVSASVHYVGDDHLIKFSPNLSEAENHISVSLSLESAGLLTAAPVKTATGEYIVADNGSYFYVTKRLAGKTIKASTVCIQDYVPKARLIGTVIGRLSTALSRVDVATNQANILKSATEWALPVLTEKMALPESFAVMYEKEFGRRYGSLPQQIIHRDPNPGNIILCGDEWGVLDFDLSERNIRVFDPCYAATAILSENFEPDNIDKLNAWITIYKNIMYGYDEVVKLSDDEWEAIPYVVITNQLITTAWFSQQEKYRELYEVNKKITAWMLHNFDEMRPEKPSDRSRSAKQL